MKLPAHTALFHADINNSQKYLLSLLLIHVNKPDVWTIVMNMTGAHSMAPKVEKERQYPPSSPAPPPARPPSASIFKESIQYFFKDSASKTF